MLYEKFWESVMPNIIEEFKNALKSGSSKLDVSGIKKHGKRKDYKADFKIINGKAHFKRSYGPKKRKR